MPNESIIKIIADNPLLFEAVKEIIIKQFNLDKLNTEMKNEELGEKVRARLDGIEKVENGFRELAKYKTVKETQNNINPAR